MDTELRPLKNTKDFFKKIIISKTSMKPWTDDDGILHLGLYEFLLNESFATDCSGESYVPASSMLSSSDITI